MVVNDQKFKAIEDISMKGGFNELGEGRNYYIYEHFIYVKIENYSKTKPTVLYFVSISTGETISVIGLLGLCTFFILLSSSRTVQYLRPHIV